MRVFAVDMYYFRRLTARVPVEYILDLLKSAQSFGPNELTGSITVEQTPYFDIRDPAGFRDILVAMLEDDDKVEQYPSESLNSGQK